MFELKRLEGTTEHVGFSYLESLRMLMDWQLRAKGYDPASVNAALMKMDSRPRSPEPASYCPECRRHFTGALCECSL